MSIATRITVDSTPTSRFNLPSAFKKAAKLVIDKQDMIAAVLSKSPMLSAEQFLVAAIAEVNSLEMSVRGDIDPGSVVKAVFNCATLGLLFGPTRGHAYLVPFNKKGTDVKLVNLIIGYKGYIELAYRSSFLKTVDTEVILQGENFRTRMTEQGRRIRHDLPVGRVADKGGSNVIGAYCLYHTRHGGYGISIVSKDEINAIRKDSDTWKYSYPAMARKTAVRRAAKNWSLTEQLSSAIFLDEHAEREEEQPSLIQIRHSPSSDISGVLENGEPSLPPSLPPSATAGSDEPAADGDLLDYFTTLDGLASNGWLVKLLESYGRVPMDDFRHIVNDLISMTDPRCAVIQLILKASARSHLADAVADMESLRQGGLISADLYAAMKRFSGLRSQELS